MASARFSCSATPAAGCCGAGGADRRQALATLVMITGYSTIAVPTGIFTAELATAMRADGQLEHDCPHCHKNRHDSAAAFCNRCRSPLFIRPTDLPDDTH